MTDVISVGISFPKIVLTKIDSKRGDVSRSRYLLRVIENELLSEEWKKNCENKRKSNIQSIINGRSGSPQSSESVNPFVRGRNPL